jgi:hypothetical protein
MPRTPHFLFGGGVSEADRLGDRKGTVRSPTAEASLRLNSPQRSDAIDDERAMNGVINHRKSTYVSVVLNASILGRGIHQVEP